MRPRKKLVQGFYSLFIPYQLQSQVFLKPPVLCLEVGVFSYLNIHGHQSSHRILNHVAESQRILLRTCSQALAVTAR